MAARRGRSKRPAQHITLPYQRAPDFRSLVADGCLIRPLKDSLIFTFYEDDRTIRSHSAKLVEAKGSVASYSLDKLDESLVRTERVTVRLHMQDALAVALLTLENIMKNRPDLVTDIPLEFLVTESTEGEKVSDADSE